MEQFPFAFDNNTDTTPSSPIVVADDASSLVTASSQGSFVPTSEDDIGMHSSSQQHTDDDDIDHLNHHDAVFANLTPHTTIQQQNRLPSTLVEPVSFGATIVELPPQPTTQQQLLPPYPSSVATNTNTNTPISGVNTATTPSSLLSGVDALKSAGSRVSSAISNLGYNLGINSSYNTNVLSTTPTIRTSNTTHTITYHPPTTISQQHYVPPNESKNAAMCSNTIKTTMKEDAAIDFAYINVTDEDEVDVWLDDGQNNNYSNLDTLSGTPIRRGNVLSILLANETAAPTSAVSNEVEGSLQLSHSEQLVQLIERGNANSTRAIEERKDGNLQFALDRHSDAARFYHQAASHIRDIDESLATSLLLLSQTQAKAALSLKNIVKLQPNALAVVFPTNNNLFRARLRGALDNTLEADISASLFLGKASKSPVEQKTLQGTTDKTTSNQDNITDEKNIQNNLVDEMMELERELREMDMTLTLGSSIAALDARTQNRMKNSVSESFMVVPGSSSFMSSSSSMILGPAPNSTSRPYNPNIGGTAGVRARANRVQSLSRPAHTTIPQQPMQHLPNQPVPTQSKHQTSTPHSLESSWWGNASMASQVLSASVISLAPGSNGPQHQDQSATSTKQLMRLMDSLRTLGEENATLLREVEDAEAARLEAKAAREQMKKFKEEYGKRFTALKEALEKFRKGYPGNTAINGEANPVTSSDFIKSASTTDQIQRQEQLIRKLTADLKKEKDESKKKDGALRKYESFYREVKARSAQKAVQKQNQQLITQPHRPPSYRGSVK